MIYLKLPRKIQLFCGWCLGRFLFVFGIRNSVILQNLEIAYPGKDSENKALRKSLFQSAYTHLGQLSLDILGLMGPFSQWIQKHTHIDGIEKVFQCLSEKRPAIFLSSHVGNWEVMAAAGALKGLPLMIVTKHLKPQWLHQEIEQGRKKCGVLAAYEPKTMRRIISHLKSGQIIGFVLDQYSGPPVGVRVPFFGVPVGTGTALATLAKRMNAVVYPVVNFRDQQGNYQIQIEDQLEWITHEDPRRELALNTAHYTSVLEKHVRTHPEQWLWTHRRFKGDLTPLKQEEWSSARIRPRLSSADSLN